MRPTTRSLPLAFHANSQLIVVFSYFISSSSFYFFGYSLPEIPQRCRAEHATHERTWTRLIYSFTAYRSLCGDQLDSMRPVLQRTSYTQKPASERQGMLQRTPSQAAHERSAPLPHYDLGEDVEQTTPKQANRKAFTRSGWQRTSVLVLQNFGPKY